MNLRQLISELERSIKVLGSKKGSGALVECVVAALRKVGLHLDAGDPGWSDTTIHVEPTMLRRIAATVESLTMIPSVRDEFVVAFETLVRVSYPRFQLDPTVANAPVVPIPNRSRGARTSRASLHVVKGGAA